MLSGYQVEVVGFHTPHGPICIPCAEDQYSTLTVERTRMGLSTGLSDEDLSPVIRYTAGEYASENGYHCGCADDLDHDIPKQGEEPEGYDGPVDAGYYRTASAYNDAGWVSLPYHEACARYNCIECERDLAA